MGMDLYMEHQQNAPRLLTEALKRECVLEARVEELEKENRELKAENKMLRESGRASLVRSVKEYDTTTFPEELGKLWEKLSDAVVKADEETNDER